MKPSSDVTGLYRSFPAYLWVEDEETRTYLEEAWRGESRIKVYVAGGHTHLHALVSAARSDWYTHVFGLRDRDFGAPNRDRWQEDHVTVFAGEALEVENWMLDAESIAACQVNTSGLDAARIEQELSRLAAPLTWWMSCRRTLSHISQELTDGFPAHPSRTEVTNRAQAEATIFGGPWWSGVLPAVHPTWGNRATVSQALVHHEPAYAAGLANGDWKRDISGKEVLRELTSKVWTRKRPPDPTGRLEFVRAIAESQRVRSRLPAEVTELRTAVLSRVGL